MNKNNEYEIDRELTGKFAIEKNVEYQEKIEQLEEENKKLKEENKKLKHENSYRAGIVDILPKGKGHIAEETIQDLQEEIKKLEEENRKLKKECEENDYLVEDNGRWMKKCMEYIKEIKELKAELKKYKKLHKYSNGELLTYSGD